MTARQTAKRKSVSARERFNLHNDIAPPRTDGISDEDADRQIVTQARRHLEFHTRMLTDRPKINTCLENRELCRFPEIVCFDETRYIYPSEPRRKFYHAQKCDGFVKADAYLVAQAPFNKETRKNFWHMCCCERPLAIVLMDDMAGQVTAFAEQFWPHLDKVLSYPDERGLRSIEVGCRERLGEAADGTFRAYSLQLFVYQQNGRETPAIRGETTLYVMRPDPSSVPGYLPQLRSELRSLKRKRAQRRTPTGFVQTGETIVLVCGDGCTKGSAFVAYDVVMDRASKTRRVGLKQTVKILRQQCYGAVHTFDDYRKLHSVLHTQLSEDDDGRRQKTKHSARSTASLE